MNCWLCEKEKAMVGALLCSFCQSESNKNLKIHKKWDRKRTKRKKILQKYRKELINKPTQLQHEALIFARESGIYFGLKVVEERIYGPYIIDIYIPRMKLAIEIDGGIHSKQLGYDDRRDRFLHKNGIMVVRFENKDVSKGFFKKAIWTLFERWYVGKNYEEIKKREKQLFG